MKCVVTGNNVKVLGRAMHCLSKIGDDIYLDPGGEGVSAMSVNSSRSAFITFEFGRDFFESYSQDVGNWEKCRISVKGILMAFRSMNVIERTVESCSLEMLEDDLEIVLICKHSVKKSYILPLIENESPKANYDSSKVRNQFVAHSKVFSDAVMNFLSNQEEVTMMADSSRFCMKNFIGNSVEVTKDCDKNTTRTLSDRKDKTVYTELVMNPSEFEEYSIDIQSELTFCLRELRPFIAFSESLFLPFKAFFEIGGEPIVFKTDCRPGFEAKLVLATVNENDDKRSHTKAYKSQSQRSQGSQPVTQAYNKRKSSTPINGEPIQDTPKCTPIPRAVPCNDEDISSSQPPRKKAKFYFKRCFDKTFNPKQICGSEKILAPDSDEDNEG